MWHTIHIKISVCTRARIHIFKPEVSHLSLEWGSFLIPKYLWNSFYTPLYGRKMLAYILHSFKKSNWSVENRVTSLYNIHIEGVWNIEEGSAYKQIKQGPLGFREAFSSEVQWSCFVLSTWEGARREELFFGVGTKEKVMMSERGDGERRWWWEKVMVREGVCELRRR